MPKFDNKLVSVVLRGNRVTVDRKDYINAKWKNLVTNFHTLTEDTVSTTLDEVLQHKKVISHPMIAAFIRADNPMEVEDK